MNPSGNDGVHVVRSVHNSEIISLPQDIIVLYNFHEDYAAMITIEHKLADTEALCNIELN